MTKFPVHRFVVMPHFNRPNVAMEAIEAFKSQADQILVLENSDREPLPPGPGYTLLPYPERPVNLSRAWNAGMDKCDEWAHAMGLDQWDIAVVNDDVLPHPEWFTKVSSAMRRGPFAAGCSGLVDVVQRAPGPVPLSHRMQGWAFILRGEKHLRADERFVWWFGDSDLDWQARQAGGMVMIAGYQVANRFADMSTTGERAEQAARDGQAFAAKWGSLRPW